MRWTVAFLPLAVSGCGDVPERRDVSVLRLSLDQFAATVQPVYENDCASPSCHGRPERPLRLYAPLAFRRDPARTHLVEPLSPEELRENFDVSAALASAADDPDDVLLLRKPLAHHASTYHGGGAIFESRADQRFLALKAWVEDGF